MDPTQPSGTIKPQVLTQAAFTPDGTLVDDTVALVDDTTALVGNQTTPTESIRVATQASPIRVTIPIRS